jgi:hypothetical protein
MIGYWIEIRQTKENFTNLKITISKENGRVLPLFLNIGPLK